MIPPDSETAPPAYGPPCYVQLDFDLLTRQILRGELESRLPPNGPSHSRANRASPPKSRFFNWPECSGSNISSEDIFYTASSRSHLQLRPVDVKMAVTPNPNPKNERTCRCCLRLPQCATNSFNCRKKGPVICWIVVAIAILIYTLSRCIYNRDFLSIWATTEGYIILSLKLVVILLGICIIWQLATWKKDETVPEISDNPAPVPVPIPYETRV